MANKKIIDFISNKADMRLPYLNQNISYLKMLIYKNTKVNKLFWLRKIINFYEDTKNQKKTIEYFLTYLAYIYELILKLEISLSYLNL
jgi:hypothetical protein